MYLLRLQAWGMCRRPTRLQRKRQPPPQLRPRAKPQRQGLKGTGLRQVVRQGLELPAQAQAMGLRPLAQDSC